MVLFLLRDGDGRRALAKEAPSLWSWATGSDSDPEALAEIDPAAERAAFEAQHGVTPEDWVLSQVVPDYEPAPWPSVVAALSVPGN